ncbi:NAD(P)/FAD-dependent oxidoreductase [Oceanibaculum sp.]|uniref:NAD(P)/FAD-dependent oxidoreductase n=1 Tax=Oceanibaculum sp. TaxID=1903597 RepID=UPI00258CAE3B|nr:FAD-binding oxidoreductase [Oceanibaculum sp.]MCH2393771.1 FAD-binding oxidoreductase [Oceanibaculum sp.]
MSKSYDVAVIGGGAIGTAVAFHLTRLGAGRVALFERQQIATGTTAQSSGLLRAHYSVPANMALAKASLEMFEGFGEMIGDEEASAGFIRCGYMIVAPEGESSQAVRGAIAHQAGIGIEARLIDKAEALELHPWLNLDDIDAIGYEPGAGFADPYLTASWFARAAKRAGADIRQGVSVEGLLMDGNRVTGLKTSEGDVQAGAVVAAMNVWSHDLTRWTGVTLPMSITRHDVLAFEVDEPYTPRFPILKDLASPSLLYTRSTSGSQILVGTGDEGVETDSPETVDADIPLDWIVEQGEALAHRMPKFEEARFVTSWSGLYDTTPDWNPVLGPLPGIEGLNVAFGLSGHGFKLSPMIGRLLAQAALGLPADQPLQPYRFTRFAEGQPLRGTYGAGAVS